MSLKFANKKVKNWENRYIDTSDIMNDLKTRMKNGFTLDSDETQFWNDTVSLFKKYNKNKQCPWTKI